MRILLCPHSSPYFGQDFTSVAVQYQTGLIPIYIKDGKYDSSKVNMSKVTLIISRSADRDADLRFIKAYSSQIPILLHLHIRYDFLNCEQKERLEESLTIATALVTNCKALCNEYKAIFPKYHWQFVNNGIDSFKFASTSIEDRIGFRSEFDIKKKTKLISFTGRLNNAKGLQLLIKILDQFQNDREHFFCIQTIEFPKYRAIITHLRKKYKNLVLITNQKIKVVRYCDIHLSTSLSETTSLVTLEALFAGLQTICTKVTDFYQEIDRGYAPFKYFHLIEIWQMGVNYEREKTKIKLSEEQTNQVAELFIKQIKRTHVHSQKEREQLSRSFGKSDYTLDRMITRLNRIYDAYDSSQSSRIKAPNLFH